MRVDGIFKSNFRDKSGRAEETETRHYTDRITSEEYCKTFRVNQLNKLQCLEL